MLSTGKTVDLLKFASIDVDFPKDSIQMEMLILKDKELKETVSDVFNSILEDDDDELKDTLNDVFNSVRK